MSGKPRDPEKSYVEYLGFMVLMKVIVQEAQHRMEAGVLEMGLYKHRNGRSVVSNVKVTKNTLWDSAVTTGRV